MRRDRTTRPQTAHSRARDGVRRARRRGRRAPVLARRRPLGRARRRGRLLPNAPRRRPRRRVRATNDDRARADARARRRDDRARRKRARVRERANDRSRRADGGRMRTIRDATAASSRDDCFDRRRRRRASRARRRARDRTRRAIGRAQSDAAVGMTSTTSPPRSMTAPSLGARGAHAVNEKPTAARNTIRVIIQIKITRIIKAIHDQAIHRWTLSATSIFCARVSSTSTRHLPSANLSSRG